MDKTPWQQEQIELQHKQKEQNEIVLAHYIKEKDGKNYRHIPVSCPRRLVEQVQKDNQDFYKENYVHIPAAKE